MKNDQIRLVTESRLFVTSLLFIRTNLENKVLFCLCWYVGVAFLLKSPLCGVCQETHVITPPCRRRMESYLVSFSYNMARLSSLNYSPCRTRSWPKTELPPHKTTPTIPERRFYWRAQKTGRASGKSPLLPVQLASGGVSYHRMRSYRQVRR